MAGQIRETLIDVDASDFLDDLEAWFQQIEVDGRAGTQRIAIDVQNRAKELCPVDTGRLRASIATDPGEDEEGFYVDVGTDVVYAEFVEFGTSKMRAQPFMRPAFAEASGGDFPLLTD